MAVSNSRGRRKWILIISCIVVLSFISLGIAFILMRPRSGTDEIASQETMKKKGEQPCCFFQQEGNVSWSSIGILEGEEHLESAGGSLDENLSNSAVAMDGSGALVAYSAEGGIGAVRIYRFGATAHAGEWYLEFEVKDVGSTSVSLSTDGRALACGSTEKGVRIYERSNGNWSLVMTYLASVEDDVGFSVVISGNGNVVAAGSRKYRNERGLVRTWRREMERNATADVEIVWTPISRLLEGETPDSNEGRAIALNHDGDVLAVGAPHYGGDDSGMVRIWRYAEIDDGSDWVAMGPPLLGSEAPSLFGFAVDLDGSGTIVSVGSRWQGRQRHGAVSVFQYIPEKNMWSPMGEPVLGARALDQLGVGVALSADGNFLIAGALGSKPFREWTAGNYAVAYCYNGTKWQKVGDTVAKGVAPSDRFGESVAMSFDGSVVAIGAAKASSKETGNTTGHVRIFQWQ